MLSSHSRFGGPCTAKGQAGTPLTHKLVHQSRRRADRPTNTCQAHVRLHQVQRQNTKQRKGAVAWRDIGRRTKEQDSWTET